MLFNSFQFAIFFAVVLCLYQLTPRNRRSGVLLGASLVFYTLWIPSYLLLLLADLAVNYALMRAMVRSARPKLFLTASIASTIGLLIHFKYSAMLVESLAPVLSGGFGWTPDVPQIFLPLGISFYSFQIIALNVDIYRGVTPPVSSFARYSLFISFFPQLIAGPILRGSEFLPQLERGGIQSSARTRRGLWLIASGIGKKVIFADFLLAPFVDTVFVGPEAAWAPFHLIAVYSFAFQIYFDFSGYTDMARGLALLLGFELPLNFTEPYLSRSPAEFWQRWHITLSTWLRDYLFFSMGGASRGSARASFNLFLTMLLGGLWHGAAWTFVLWGGYQGLLLVLHRTASPMLAKLAPASPSGRRLWNVLCVFVTFHLMCIGLIFFRATSFADGMTILTSLTTTSYVHGWPAMQMGVVALCMMLHGLERAARLRLSAIQATCATRWWGTTAEGLALGALVAWAIAVSGSGGEFIYFQF
jgi:alginate O-acetyltransferase complex protein AlgI